MHQAGEAHRRGGAAGVRRRPMLGAESGAEAVGQLILRIERHVRASVRRLSGSDLSGPFGGDGAGAEPEGARAMADLVAAAALRRRASLSFSARAGAGSLQTLRRTGSEGSTAATFCAPASPASPARGLADRLKSIS